MKRKPLIMILAFLLFPAMALSQQNYYPESGVIHVGDQSYSIEVKQSLFSIRNVKNNAPILPTHLDGTPYAPGFPPVAKLINREEVRNILQEVFTREEIDRFKNAEKKIMVGYTMDVSGNVFEVGFSVPLEDRYLSLPPERFYLFEKLAKERLKWHVEDRFKDSSHIAMTGYLFFDDL